RLEDGFPAADIVLCIDVLIHQKTRTAFLSLIDTLAGATRRRLVVGGYEAHPRFTSEITAYHLPLSQALKNTGRFQNVQVVGEYRDMAIVIAGPHKFQESAGANTTSPYCKITEIREHVTAGHHRAIVGGAWEEIGRLQFEFLTGNGLKPHHRLLDVGCGALRGGLHFIRYLDEGNYVGVDL